MTLCYISPVLPFVGHFSSSSSYLDYRVLLKPLYPLQWFQHSVWRVGYEVKSMSLLLRQWPLLLGCLRYSSLCTLIIKPFLLMTLCYISPVLPFSGVLILGLPLMRWPRIITCFFRFLVIPFGPSLTCTPFLLRNVHFCMPLWQMLLWVCLLFSFDPWLRFIGVVLLHMVFSSLFLFIGFCYI